MKALFLILLLSFSLPIQDNATYIVLSVTGQVRIEGQNKFLKRGDKIAEADNLLFGSKQDKLAVISPGKGSFVIQAKRSKRKDGEFLIHAKSALGLDNSFVHTGSRTLTESESSDAESMTHIFTGHGKSTDKTPLFFIGDTATFDISSNKKVKIDKENYFLIGYWNDGLYINQEIPMSKNRLKLHKGIFKNEDEEVISTDRLRMVQILYRSFDRRKEGENLTIVATIHPNFISEEQFTEEIDLLKKNAGDLKKEDYNEKLLMPYIQSFYGEITSEESKIFCKEKLNMKFEEK